MKAVSNILAISLAILVFFSSSYVVIDTHLCCGNVIDSSIFGKADVCEMDMISCRSENISNTKVKGNCCNNLKDYKYGNSFVQSSFINVDLQQQFNYTPHFYLAKASILFIGTEVSNRYVKEYTPPLISRDILVLVQCFLI